MPETSSPGSGRHRPVYLLADSRLLFKVGGERPSLLDRMRKDLPATATEPLRAAYLGAANGDEPAFYEIFAAAMDLLGIAERRFLRTRPAPGDLDFLAAADLILLAGGEVGRGWRAFEASGTSPLIAERYHQGALLVGVSAGAVQLGRGLLEQGADRLFETAGLLPFLVDAHAEPDWQALKKALHLVPDYLGGLGIPFGGAAIVHPDMTVEPVEKPVIELFRRGDLVQEALLMPPIGTDADSFAAQ